MNQRYAALRAREEHFCTDEMRSLAKALLQANADKEKTEWFDATSGIVPVHDGWYEVQSYCGPEGHTHMMYRENGNWFPEWGYARTWRGLKEAL